MELVTSFEICAEDTRESLGPVSQSKLVVVKNGLYTLAPSYVTSTVERIGMYVVTDDLPSPEEIQDDEECERFIANSRKVG